MTHTTRRSFLERLGLGAGRILLAPVALDLVREAYGAEPARKRAVFFLASNGLHHEMVFTPPEFRQDSELAAPVLDGPRTFTWPEAFAPLAPYRHRSLLVDGLTNRPKSTQGHTAGYAALTCRTWPVGPNNGRESVAPAGISIDQHVAEHIGANTSFRSVRFGVQNRVDGPQVSRVFAFGEGRPAPHYVDPRALYTELFGSAGPAGAPSGGGTRKRLLDAISSDIKRLQGALAGTERGKLDQYLAAIEQYDKRQASVATCRRVEAPGALRATEDLLESMLDMSLVALACGVTNVLCISAGCGNTHTTFPKYTRIHKGTSFEAQGFVTHEGHSPDAVQRDARTVIARYHTGLVARVVETLSAIKEGNGTAFDASVVLYFSDNAHQHHSNKERWPVLVVGNAGGTLRADGRFVRFPLVTKNAADARSMGDFFSTLATALGRPTNDFGRGGNEPTTGVLEPLLV